MTRTGQLPRESQAGKFLSPVSQLDPSTGQTASSLVLPVGSCVECDSGTEQEGTGCVSHRNLCHHSPWQPAAAAQRPGIFTCRERGSKSSSAPWKAPMSDLRQGSPNLPPAALYPGPAQTCGPNTPARPCRGWRTPSLPGGIWQHPSEPHTRMPRPGASPTAACASLPGAVHYRGLSKQSRSPRSSWREELKETTAPPRSRGCPTERDKPPRPSHARRSGKSLHID